MFNCYRGILKSITDKNYLRAMDLKFLLQRLLHNTTHNIWELHCHDIPPPPPKVPWKHRNFPQSHRLWTSLNTKNFNSRRERFKLLVRKMFLADCMQKCDICALKLLSQLKKNTNDFLELPQSNSTKKFFNNNSLHVPFPWEPHFPSLFPAQFFSLCLCFFPF